MTTKFKEPLKQDISIALNVTQHAYAKIKKILNNFPNKNNTTPQQIPQDQISNFSKRVSTLLRHALDAAKVLREDTHSLNRSISYTELRKKISHIKTYDEEIITKLESYLKYWKDISHTGTLPWFKFLRFGYAHYNNQPILKTLLEIYHKDQNIANEFMRFIDEVAKNK
jgi:hypothetical protein